jgi:hypothetical protein
MKARSGNGKSAKEIQSTIESVLAALLKSSLRLDYIFKGQDNKVYVEMPHKHCIDASGAKSSREFGNGHQGEEVIVICND